MTPLPNTPASLAELADQIVADTTTELTRILGISGNAPESVALLMLVSAAIRRAFGCICWLAPDTGAVHAEDVLCPLHRETGAR